MFQEEWGPVIGYRNLVQGPVALSVSSDVMMAMAEPEDPEASMSPWRSPRSR